jgi:hypothetical protein
MELCLLTLRRAKDKAEFAVQERSMQARMTWINIAPLGLCFLDV